MLGLLDAAIERLTDRFHGEQEARIEAVRVGTIIAHDRNAAHRYRLMLNPRPSLDDQALEAAIANVALLFPGNVSREARA